MEKLYGDRLRKDGGLTKTFKQVAGKHVRSLESRAGRHAPEIKRVVSEVKGTLEKVEEKVTEAVQEFLQHGESSVIIALRLNADIRSQLVLASMKSCRIPRFFFNNLESI